MKPENQARAAEWGLGPDGWPLKPELVQPYRGAGGVPLAKSRRKRSWRKTEVLTFGERLLDECDPEREILTLEQHKQICALQDGDAVAALLHNDFGSYKLPNLTKAAEVFGALAADGISVPRLILVLRFQTVAQLLMVIDDARKLHKDVKYTKAERLDGLKCAKEASMEMAKIVGIIEKAAIKMGYIEKDLPASLPIVMPETEKVPVIGSAPELE